MPYNNNQVYVAGYTMATDFPGTTGGAQSANAGDMDVFIARLDQGLENLWQATYFGGSSREMAFGPTSQPGTATCISPAWPGPPACPRSAAVLRKPGAAATMTHS